MSIFAIYPIIICRTMKKSLKYFLSIISLFTIINIHAAVDTNVVIEQLDYVCRFIPTKDGRLERIDVSTQATFRARRAPETAYLIEYYDDFVKVKKASGGEVSYNPVISGNVFYNDTKRCAIAVDLRKAGDKGKASLNLSYTKPEFVCFDFVQRIYDIENATYTFEIPSSIAGRYNVDTRFVPNGMLLKNMEQKSDKTIITYTAGNIPQMKTFDNAPSIRLYAPQFVITGHFADHNEVYRYLRSYIPDSDPAGQIVIDKAKEVTANAATDAERIAAITDFVHDNIRYVAVENGELGHRPDLPSEVLRKAYGDCKGSAALIKAMLKAVGIDGRLAWIGVEGVGHTYTEIPNLSAGNHMIAAAVTGDSLLFIDGTARQTPALKVPSGDQGCQCLVEDTYDKCIIATVPQSSPEANAHISRMTVTMLPEGRLHASGQIELRGGIADMFFSIMTDTPPAKHDNYFCRIFESTMKSSHANSVTLNNEGECPVLSGSLYTDGAVKHIVGETFVELNPASSLQRYKFDLDERTAPGHIGDIGMISNTLSLDIPEGMTPSFLPENVAVKNDWIAAELTTGLSLDSRQVIRTLNFKILKKIIPLESLKSFNDDLSKLIISSSKKIGLRQSGPATSENR